MNGGFGMNMPLINLFICFMQGILFGSAEMASHGSCPLGVNPPLLNQLPSIKESPPYYAPPPDVNPLLLQSTTTKTLTSTTVLLIRESVHSFHFIGHGGFYMNMALINRFVCFMQVGPSYCSRKSDDCSLLLQPCPHQCSANVHPCFSALKTLWCGDIELNLGLSTERMFKKIKEGQNE
ncbi:hypothetical protein HPB48_011812 [Haemaphysalis longicornis]|uniref:Uncharacterized protein n=1 Tax=Haemaphysalis longicornis TaxID=44386 RepID=A0A9J6GKZ3_HAELO|nr:hypothetical protein HPB48_011812 [Haemaphysalis longicornis]